MAGRELVRTAAVRWLGAGSHPGGVALTRSVLAGLPLAPGDLALDVGCGTGRTLELLSAAGVRAVGVDVDEARLRAAARRSGRPRSSGPVVRPPVALARADAARLPLGDDVVDVALAECVVSTLPDPGAALAEVVRVLRPGGALAMTDVTVRPELDEEAPDVARAVRALTTPRPLEAWVALLEESGLRVVEAREVPAAAASTVRRVRRRLTPARLLPRAATTAGADALRVADAAVEAVGRGLLGYAALRAVAPG